MGYILGLGDRHPSNLMLDRLSGKIMHIDFGDCFEVAMTREKFPEKIPFRLGISSSFITSFGYFNWKPKNDKLTSKEILFLCFVFESI